MKGEKLKKAKTEKAQKELLLTSTRFILLVLVLSYITPNVMNTDIDFNAEGFYAFANATNNTNSTNPTGNNGTTTTNCTVDKCQTCVDSVQITCASCKTGWYKKTFSGGNKSYDVCWAIWKLLLALLFSCCLCCCCGACMYYFRRRGIRGQDCCCNLKRMFKNEINGPSRESQYLPSTNQPTPRIIRAQPRPVSVVRSPQ